MPGAPRYTYIIATPEAVAGCPATDDSCGVDNENWTCVVRRRVGKWIQCACAPMAERVRYCGLRIVGVIFEFSEHSEHSEGLADARLCLV